MQNKFNANEWFVENLNDENVPNKSEKLEGDTLNTREKPVVWESYEDETEETVVLNNENTTADSNTNLTKKRQGIKIKAWQILCAVLVVVIVIMSVLIFTRNKPTVAVDNISTSESQDEQLPEIAESISENTQEENSDETENNEEDSAETDEKANGNNVTNKSENSVTTTKKNSGSSSSSNTSKSTTTQAGGGNNDTSDNFTWSLVNGVLTISPKRNGEKVEIENFYSELGQPWGEQRKSITKIIIKNGIKNIPDYAFAECTALTSVTIPNSVKTIGNSVFSRCYKLTDINIPNSVTSIGEWAFYDCTGLTSINIPNSVKTIGKCAFCYCTGFTSVTIPNGVTTIGDDAFFECGLNSITIPNSVTTIGEGVFNQCYSLDTINYSGTKAQWAAISKGEDWDQFVGYHAGEYTIYCSDGSIKKQLY